MPTVRLIWRFMSKCSSVISLCACACYVDISTFHIISWMYRDIFICVVYGRQTQSSLFVYVVEILVMSDAQSLATTLPTPSPSEHAFPLSYKLTEGNKYFDCLTDCIAGLYAKHHPNIYTCMSRIYMSYVPLPGAKIMWIEKLLTQRRND